MQNTNMNFSHLYLSRWPFQTVPDENFACLWAGRKELKQQIDRLIWKWPRTDRGYLQLMWADLGSGKTHTLLHIYQHCLKHPDIGILPIFSVMPKEIRSFLDVYQSIMATLDMPILADIFAQACRNAGSTGNASKDLFPSIPDAATVFRKMQSDSESTKRLAKAWLTGTRGITRSQLSTLEVSRAIKTTDDCVAMLRGVVRLVTTGGKYRRVLIMLDECQRIWRYKTSINKDIDTGLQTWYDLSHKGLTLVLSFRCGYEKYMYDLISPDLKSRSDLPNIRLPLLLNDEALEFTCDLLSRFRVDGSPSPWYPFNEKMVKAVINHLTEREGISPRRLMNAFNALLEEADYQITTEGQFNIKDIEIMRLVDNALHSLADETD